MSGAIKQLAARQRGGPLVSDSFDRADSTTSLGTADSGQVWTAHSGTWGISSNKGYLASTTGQAAASVDAGASDVEVSADITLSPTTDRADAGLVFRLADDSNYLLALINKVTGSNSIQLFKRQAGSFTHLASVGSQGHVNGTTYDLRVVANGSSIEVFRDDTSVLTHTLSGADLTTFGSNTRHGLRVHRGSTADDGGTRFDNFLVETL